MRDSLDIVKNIENIYNSDTAFSVLKDFERVIDDLDLYVYANWENGELAQGPDIDRHFVTCAFVWEADEMPDPMGAKRLVDYDCKVTYKKDSVVVPRKIKDPDDMRPGTKKGKLDRKPVWLVNIKMPKSLLGDIAGGYQEQIASAVEPAVAPTPMQEPQDADQALAGTEPEIGAV
jgi:hypothetical protein